MRLVCLLLLLLCPRVHAGPLLDPDFGSAGLRVLDTLGGLVDGLGACPHADGSISVVGYRPASAALVIVRLTARGQLDPTFSGDGIQELPVLQAFASERSATSCAGTGNSAPEDDRMMVVGTVPGARDVVLAALIDLHTGTHDSSFYLGGPGQYDISGILYPPQNNQWLYPRTAVRGVFPGPAGGWLILGQLDGHSNGVPVGFIARLNAAGAIDALVHPAASGFSVQDLSTARLAADGDIRALAQGTTAQGPTFGLLRLHPLTLETLALSQLGTPDGFDYRLYKGRQIGGGLMVAAALHGDNSAFGAHPALLVVRGDQVSELALPPPPTLDQIAVGPSGSAAATGAVGNRAVFAMGLNSLSASGVGYYVAAVQLGDGAGVADAVDPRFAQNGAGSFRYRPAAGCTPGSAPVQRFANLSSWGNATLLVGSSAPGCAPSAEGKVLSARLWTDGERLHRDGYE